MNAYAIACAVLIALLLAAWSAEWTRGCLADAPRSDLLAYLRGSLCAFLAGCLVAVLVLEVWFWRGVP